MIQGFISYIVKFLLLSKVLIPSQFISTNWDYFEMNLLQFAVFQTVTVASLNDI